MLLRKSISSLLLLGIACHLASAEPIRFTAGDVVAFIGGADVSAAQHTGHLETLLAREFPGTRFRNFGWAGDTVFAQPRDYNFPPLQQHLQKARCTIAFVQFGRAEALNEDRADFATAYRKLLDDLQPIVPKLILVTPIPFEKAPPPLPDLAARNPKLMQISESIRAIAKERNLPLVDLFQALHRGTNNLTDDGLQLTTMGHAVVANAFARDLGLPSAPLTDAGEFADPNLADLRAAIIAKNRLWFDYWRPQNWAFLGGDRTEQPSSRDHRDPAVRWFPAEIERYPALIANKEATILRLAKEASKQDQP